MLVVCGNVVWVHHSHDNLVEQQSTKAQPHNTDSTDESLALGEILTSIVDRQYVGQSKKQTIRKPIDHNISDEAFKVRQQQ